MQDIKGTMKKKDWRDTYQFCLLLFLIVASGYGIVHFIDFMQVTLPRPNYMELPIESGISEPIKINSVDGIILQQQGMDVTIKDVLLSADVGYTGSMIPTIVGGNTLLLRLYPYYNMIQNGTCLGIKEGQIAVYFDEDITTYASVVHRVIDNDIGGGQIRFKGDNNNASEFVRCEDIKYLVVGVIYT